MVDVDVFQRALDRERRARKQAEALLEEQSRQLYYANEELRDTTEALRRESSKTIMILRTAADAIITFDDQGIIEAMNPATERIFGYQDSDLLGKNIRILLGSDKDQEEFEQLDDDFWSDSCAASVSRQGFGKRRDGTVFEMEYSGSRIETCDKLLSTWIVRDITDRNTIDRQLTFAQKMESVGRLAAGIAHEINTPIQYVGDNTAFLDTAFKDLESLLSLYGELHSSCHDGEKAQELTTAIGQKVEEIDLEFLREEIPSAISQSTEGASRVARIVRAMKEFSHPGSQEKTQIDLNSAIESTIMVSRNEWKYVAEIETDLDPTLPSVPCFPGDLNQAILNLIVNASHAIADAESQNGRGTIKISTRADEEYVEVRITDTGCGIPSDVLGKIYEPFFTTKDVGKGTGQGLSIVYSVVVEKHGGTVNVETEIGQGTTFIVRLPRCPIEEEVKQ